MKRLVSLAFGLAAGLAPLTPALAADGAQPIRIGLTHWFAATPTANAHTTLSLSAPLGDTRWLVMTAYTPTLGSGHLNVGHVFDLGPVALTPSVGLRYFGAGNGTSSADARGFELGPEVRLGAAVPIQSWLYIWLGTGYAPYLVNPAGGGSGSYLDLAAALQATVGPVSVDLGFGGLWFNGGQSGNPTGNFAMGGPIVGTQIHF